jgi:hypothetical protein
MGAMGTIGRVREEALRGQLARTLASKSYVFDIPVSFLAMFVGFIDGDGYIAVTKTTEGFISIALVISLQRTDKALLDYFKSVLKIGTVTDYPESGSVKYIISRTDLQEILFPLMLYHGIFFLTTTRRAQYELAIALFMSDITLFSRIKTLNRRNTLSSLPLMPSGYIALPFFLNWIVGFTMSEGSFFLKTSGELFYSLKQRSVGHIQLFEAIK